MPSAVKTLESGRPILIYDFVGREEETDLVFLSSRVTPEAIRTMRKDGGGLINVAIPHSIAEKLGLPFMDQVLQEAASRYPHLAALVRGPIPYDKRSSFSLTINHRDTYTGISDRDRSLTIRKFDEMGRQADREDNGGDAEAFGLGFRSPGHVGLLIAVRDLLTARQGHTELSLALLQLAGVQGTTTICEMLGDEGSSLSREHAKDYAHRENLPFLDGEAIARAWKAWSK